MEYFEELSNAHHVTQMELIGQEKHEVDAAYNYCKFTLPKIIYSFVYIFSPPKLLMLLLRRLKQYRNKWTRLLGIKSKILTVMSKLVRHAGCTLCFLVRCKERASLSF